jgi:hypothetical protein
MPIYDSSVTVWRVKYWGVLEDGSDERFHVAYIEAEDIGGVFAAMRAIDEDAQVETIQRIRVIHEKTNA